MKKYLFLAFIAVFSMFGADTNSKLAAELGQTNPNSTVNVIVQWRTTSIEAHHRKVSDRGGRLHRRLKSIRSASYSLPAYELNNLANDPDVAYITPDRPVRASLDYTTAAINAGAAWSAQLDGRGVGVAVIDSGINSNPNFGAQSNRIFGGFYRRSSERRQHGESAERSGSIRAWRARRRDYRKRWSDIPVQQLYAVAERRSAWSELDQPSGA